MKRMLYVSLAAIVMVYIAACVAAFLLQRSLIYFPQPRQVQGEIMRLPVEGAELIVSIRPHLGSKAVLYFGGNAEDVSQNLPNFSAAFPDHALYLLHYRGYGGSTGNPSEENNHRDAAALFDAVRREHAQIAVIGRSLGSGIAVRIAAERPVSRLVLVAPCDSIAEIAASALPYLPVRFLLLDRYDSGKYAPSIKVPTAIIAAEHDEVVPAASTRKLLSRFPQGVASMTIIPGAGHNNLGIRTEYGAALRTAMQ
jgi:pimeloyl-ACP methyl ester carboxylesterase